MGRLGSGFDGASGFVLPIASDSLHKDESVMARNVNYQKKYMNTRDYPSRVPRATSFCLLARFTDKADVPPDGCFEPPADTSTSFAGAAESPTGYDGAVGATSSPTLPSTALLEAASAFAFASTSLLATNCSRCILAFIASMDKSACAIHA